MVVCRCRKATKLYCFVHKTPVCGECICSQEHHICVVKTYSEWVIDGDYDWPPKCGQCHELLHIEGNTTIRLGCLHVFHKSCLIPYVQSLPSHTAPAGYTCPTCGASIWPPKIVKELNSSLLSKLKDFISQSGLSKNLLGNEPVNLDHGTTPTAALPSFPSVTTTLASTHPFSVERNNGLLLPGVSGHDASVVNIRNHLNGFSASANKENLSDAVLSVAPIEGNEKSMGPIVPHSTLNVASLGKAGSTATSQAGATTRKMPYRGDKMSFVDATKNDDDDGAMRKYNRRGPFHRQILRYLLPFWSPAMPTLPVTTLGRKDDRDASVAEELIEGRHRRRHRSSAIDPGRILLIFAILSCLATMILLYYRLSQGAFRGGLPQVEEQ